MNSEKQIELFQKLKKEFFKVTSFDDYDSINFNFEIDQYNTTDDELIVNVKINWKDVKTFYIKISIDTEENLLINTVFGYWEKWTSFDYNIRELFLVIIFEALDA